MVLPFTQVPLALRPLTMTPVVNKKRPRPTFLNHLLMRHSEPELLDTTAIQIEKLVDTRRMVPFVTRGSASVPFGTTQRRVEYAEAPFINVNKPLVPQRLFETRQFGQSLYPSSGEMSASIRRYIADELETLQIGVDDREEWMLAQMLTGTITYQSEGHDAFTITYPRPGTHTYTLSTYWNQAAGGGLVGNTIPGDFQTAIDLIFEEEQMNVSDVVLGKLAAAAFVNAPHLADIFKNQNRDTRFILGEIDFTRPYTELGAQYLGSVNGVRVWKYARTYVNDAGSLVPFVGDKMAHFIVDSAATENKWYFGAIEDWDLLLRTKGVPSSGRMARIRRFAKSVMVEDPSSIKAIIQTSPLPVPRRPGAYVSVQVLA